MINPMNLDGHVILVTGASSGIGRSTAILLSQLGARVVLVARDRDKLIQTATLMSGTGHLTEPRDLTEMESMDEWFGSIAERTGPLHGLVHCAGTQKTRPLRTLRRKNVEEVMAINFSAAVELTRAFARKGVFSDSSSVVFVSGGVALVGQAGVAAYAASKGALVALARSLAVELAKDGIRVNCVCPGFVETSMLEGLRNTLPAEQLQKLEKMHPLGFGRPIDVAHAIAFLLADAGRWITGTAVFVDGGYTATAH